MRAVFVLGKMVGNSKGYTQSMQHRPFVSSILLYFSKACDTVCDVKYEYSNVK